MLNGSDAGTEKSFPKQQLRVIKIIEQISSGKLLALKSKPKGLFESSSGFFKQSFFISLFFNFLSSVNCASTIGCLILVV